MELRDRLRSKKLKPLYSRLINPTVLAPMSLSEVEKMIQHRCDYYKLQNPFPSPAIRRVYELSGGTPRDVLRICGTAYQMLQLMKIDSAPAELIDQAYAELQLELPQVEEEEAA
jgi:hypothetical protein